MYSHAGVEVQYYLSAIYLHFLFSSTAACRKSLTDESDDGLFRSYSPFQHSDLFYMPYLGSLKSLRYCSMLVVLLLLLAPQPLNRVIYEV